jgi:hypothetical protein
LPRLHPSVARDSTGVEAMRLRQLISAAAAVLSESAEDNLRDLGVAMATLADNGSGDDIYAFLGAIRPLTDVAERLGA